MTTADLVAYRWGPPDRSPLIRHSRLSPLIADPAVVRPEDSPDGTWHLFAHSAWGIHRYLSHNGLVWADRGLVLANAMRPWIFQEGRDWFLLTESYPRLALALSWVPGRAWRSRIEMRRSGDLVRWGPPVSLLEPCLPWHRAEGLGEAVGNPCLVAAGCGYRLYYSASLVRVPDCGFNEPVSIGVAEARSIEGPYEPLPRPVLIPDAADPLANLSRGALRAVRLDDGWAGFANGISFDPRKGVSSSSIQLLGSPDGLSWERLAPRSLVEPGSGWMRSHVYACCPVLRGGGEIHLYFNARDDWPLSRGRECIGRAVGMPGEARG